MLHRFAHRAHYRWNCFFSSYPLALRAIPGCRCAAEQHDEATRHVQIVRYARTFDVNGIGANAQLSQTGVTGCLLVLVYA